jgi:hypothetical protein
VQAVSVFICTFSLCAIAIDRYVLILHPHVKLMNKRGALGVTVILWALSIVITLPYTIFMDLNSHPGLCGEFCTEQWPHMHTRVAYTVFVMATQFIVPFAIMALCYWMIFAKLVVIFHLLIYSIYESPGAALTTNKCCTIRFFTAPEFERLTQTAPRDLIICGTLVH